MSLLQPIRTVCGWFLAGVVTCAPAAAGTRDRLERLAEAMVESIRAEDPIKASALGLTDADGRLLEPTEATRSARVDRLEHWKAGQRMVTRPGRLFGIVGRRQLAGATDFLAGALSTAAAAQLANRPSVRARFKAARDATLATLADTRAHIDAQVDRWPENYAIGKPAYEQMLHDALLLPFDAADIEHMARDELAHAWAEEAWLKAAAAKRHTTFGPASGGGLAPGGAALIGYYQARIDDLTAFVRDHDVVTVPGWLGSMKIVETPAFLQPVSPGASMRAPRLFARSTTGYYFITPPRSFEAAAERLDMNEDFDRDRILSTAAHEAMPGQLPAAVDRAPAPEPRAPVAARRRLCRGLGVLWRGDVRPARA